MGIVQLIYASQPFGFDDAMLNGILDASRRNNWRDDITGCLICRQDLYLQLIEGPVEMVDAAFARIAIDDRHLDVRRLCVGPVVERMFPDWAMRDDPARSWLWTSDQVAEGAAEAASPLALRAIFARVRSEADQ